MRALLKAALLGLVVTACRNELAPPVGDIALPAIGIAVSGGANVTRSASAEVTVTVSRLSGFIGSIDVSVDGLPAGVTAAFAPATVPASATTSTLTLSASATATLGTVISTLRASAGGLNGASTQLVIAVSP